MRLEANFPATSQNGLESNENVVEWDRGESQDDYCIYCSHL